MDRREFIRCGVGIAGIIAAGKAPASIVKSLVGAKYSAVDKVQGKEIPYLADGLLAMWDGEWNAGVGIHNEDINGFIDLISGKEMTVKGERPSSGVVNKNFIHFDGKWHYEDVLDDINLAIDESRCTLEIVARFPVSSGVSYPGCAKFGKTSSNRGVGVQGVDAFVFANTIDYRGSYKNTNIATLKTSSAKAASLSIVCDTTVGHIYTFGVYRVDSKSSTTSVSGGQTIFGAYWGGNNICDIYNVRAYSRHLSAEEIMYNYKVDVKRFGL